jgi:hypothetical protein
VSGRAWPSSHEGPPLHPGRLRNHSALASFFFRISDQIGESHCADRGGLCDSSVVPEDAQRVHRIISLHIRNCAIADVLCEAADPELNVYLITTHFLNGHPNIGQNRPTDLAGGAAKAVIKKPSLFDSQSGITGRNVAAIDPDDVVALALSSDGAMKFVLSRIVPLIMEKNLQAYEVIQRIAAAGRRGEPACLLAELLKQKQGISCLMTDSVGVGI